MLKFITVIIALCVSLVLGIWFLVATFRRQNIRATKFFASAVSENKGPSKILALGVYFWVVFLILACGMLLFLALTCAFYTLGLIHGEIYLLLGAIGPTAGNIAAHLFYPLEIFLLGLAVMVLFIGTFQIFLGPIQPLSRLALQVLGIEDLCRKLIWILMVVILLELTKTVTYSLLAAPPELAQFFTADQIPLMKPVPMAAVAFLSMTGGAGVLSAINKKNRGENHEDR